MNYLVKYRIDNHESDETFEADNPGAAFALCLKKWPEATLIKASTYGTFGVRGGHCELNYNPPPVQRAPHHVRTGPRKQRKNDPEGKFPF